MVFLSVLNDQRAFSGNEREESEG